MKEVTITIRNAVYSTTDARSAQWIAPCLSFVATYWKQGKFAKTPVEYNKCMFEGRGAIKTFLTGYIPRIRQYCERQNISLTILGRENIPNIYRPIIPYLENIEFRDDQKRMISKGVNYKRGVLIAPVRTGKTIIGLGMISCFPNARALFLVHSKDLLLQTYVEAIKCGFEDIARIGAGYKDSHNRQFVIATAKSYVKRLQEELTVAPDIIIVDECHRVSKFDGEFGKILSSLRSPMRWGLTATPPSFKDRPLAAFANEGLLGPIIDRITPKESQDIGASIKPKLRLIKSEFKMAIKQTRKYSDVYDIGIVYNKQRNQLIMNTAKEYVDKGKSVLILIGKLEHGANLLDAGRPIMPNRVRFVQGNSSNAIRMRLKDALHDKVIKCVICSPIWREGVNIPSLDVTINAVGGKSEIPVLQGLGRNLTTWKGKEEAIIVDIFDPSNHFLISHFGERITLYSDMGWL